MIMGMLDIQFKTTNNAFEGEGKFEETVRILHSIAKRIDRGEEDGVVRDINGNEIGSWYLS